MFGSFPPSPLVALRLQSLLGPGSRHCYGIITLIDGLTLSEIQGMDGGHVRGTRTPFYTDPSNTTLGVAFNAEEQRRGILKKALLVVVLSLLSVAASPVPPVQTSPACPTDKGMPPQCLPGSHPVGECVCDGPAGPCHWVWHCKKD